MKIAIMLILMLQGCGGADGPEVVRPDVAVEDAGPEAGPPADVGPGAGGDCSAAYTCNQGLECLSNYYVYDGDEAGYSCRQPCSGEGQSVCPGGWYCNGGIPKHSGIAVCVQ